MKDEAIAIAILDGIEKTACHCSGSHHKRKGFGVHGQTAMDVDDAMALQAKSALLVE